MLVINHLYIILASFVWAHMTGIPQRFKWAFGLKRIKPFDCELCLSFWLCGGLSFYNGNSLYICIAHGLICGGCSNLIYLVCRRLALI